MPPLYFPRPPIKVNQAYFRPTRNQHTPANAAPYLYPQHPTRAKRLDSHIIHTQTERQANMRIQIPSQVVCLFERQRKSKANPKEITKVLSIDFDLAPNELGIFKGEVSGEHIISALESIKTIAGEPKISKTGETYWALGLVEGSAEVHKVRNFRTVDPLTGVSSERAVIELKDLKITQGNNKGNDEANALAQKLGFFGKPTTKAKK